MAKKPVATRSWHVAFDFLPPSVNHQYRRSGSKTFTDKDAASMKAAERGRRRNERMVYPKERASDLIKAALEWDQPCILIRQDLYRDLQAELGGTEPAMEWIRAVLRVTQKVLLINSPLPGGGSQSVVIPPPNWDLERLQAETARLRPFLEAGLGPMESITVKRGTWPG